MLDFLLWLLGEMLINGLPNLPFLLLREPRQEPIAVRWMIDLLGTLAVGALAGLLSVVMWSHVLLVWTPLRWVNLILSPFLASALVVLWRRRRADATLHGLIRSGAMAFCLTLSLVAVRHFSLA